MNKKGIIGKGLTYDMYKYQEEDLWFSTFPYNDKRSLWCRIKNHFKKLINFL